MTPPAMTPEQEDEFRWAYCITRTDAPNCPPLQYFDRLTEAKQQVKELQEKYPDMVFGVFARGDQLFMGDPAIHENVH